LVFVAAVLAAEARAQCPVTVTLAAQEASGAAIPADFIGLSFGMRALVRKNDGAHFFSPTNAQLITLFQNLGIRHLRVGGTSVEWPPETPIPGKVEIDRLFAFARAAQVSKVIYSLRLLETNADQHFAVTDGVIARYIWYNYRPLLDCFAIGNEPDRGTIYTHDPAITNFASYLLEWRRFAEAVRKQVPEATFGGPDAGSGNIDWTTRFARAEKSKGRVAIITEHFYAGGAGRGKTPEQGIADMLSPAAEAANQRLYERMAKPVLADRLPYRFTETNDHYSGGVRGASDTFSGALWALDFLHWWAAHGTRGVDFHNTQWVVNDVISRDSKGGLRINPKGYGLTAFDAGSHGNIDHITVSNPDRVNLAAYSVSDATNHWVTLINKEHGSGARWADVMVAAPRLAASAAVMFLTAKTGDATATDGVTLGGRVITADAPWSGSWTALPAPQAGRYTVRVPATSAAIVRISSTGKVETK
jgi:hypothetical protein